MSGLFALLSFACWRVVGYLLFLFTCYVVLLIDFVVLWICVCCCMLVAFVGWFGFCDFGLRLGFAVSVCLVDCYYVYVILFGSLYSF